MRQNDELLIFTAFDSARDTGGTLHSAIVDPTAPLDEAERHSIDTRVLVAWDVEGDDDADGR